MKVTHIAVRAATLWVLVCAPGCEGERDEEGLVSREQAQQEVRELEQEIDEQNAGEGFIEAPEVGEEEGSASAEEVPEPIEPAP